jgi:hypothetical protein
MQIVPEVSGSSPTVVQFSPAAARTASHQLDHET